MSLLFLIRKKMWFIESMLVKYLRNVLKFINEMGDRNVVYDYGNGNNFNMDIFLDKIR